MGSPLGALTNFVRWNTPKDKLVQSYRVDFDPEIESSELRRFLVNSKRELWEDAAYVFDGGNELKTLTRLESEVTSVFADHPKGGGVTLTFRHTSTVPWGHPEMLHLYNTLMRQNLRRLGMIQMGKNFFDREQRVRLSGEHLLQLWPGMITTVNEHDAGILMVLGQAYKIVRNKNVNDLLTEIRSRDSDPNLVNAKNIARNLVQGQIVYVGYSNKTYRIDDIQFRPNVENQKFTRNGVEMTIYDYMTRERGLTVNQPQQPLLIVRSTARQRRGGQADQIYLVPELCLLTGLTDEMRGDFRLMREIFGASQSTVDVRIEEMKKFLSKIHAREAIKANMAKWGLQIGENLLKTQCYLLAAEKIMMQEGIQHNRLTGKFEEQIRGRTMREPQVIQKWLLIAESGMREDCNNFLNEMKEVQRPFGLQMQGPNIYYTQGRQIRNFLEGLDSLRDEHQIVVFLVPNQDKECYKAIKNKLCCENNPRPSQIVTRRVFNNPRNVRSIVTKILIQMAVKLGAVPWSVHLPETLRVGFMIVGFDVHHSRGKKSVGGFVCSLNGEWTKWYSRTMDHQTNEELSTNFAMFFVNGLKEYYKYNHNLPGKIIVYRDGVSEGQIQHVFDTELQQMVLGLDQVRNKFNMKDRIPWAFTIVTKRVHARFFHEVTTNVYKNPGPGMVVDQDITRKQRLDYYLVCQAVSRGTVCPVMYNVIADTTGYALEKHQILSYKLSHLYYNWAGTISVPAPCQYAHRLAYLTGTALVREAHSKLHGLLYYL